MWFQQDGLRAIVYAALDILLYRYNALRRNEQLDFFLVRFLLVVGVCKNPKDSCGPQSLLSFKFSAIRTNTLFYLNLKKALSKGANNSSFQGMGNKNDKIIRSGHS